MIIKSTLRGGYRAAADYMKDIGKNEKTRVVEIGVEKAKDLDEAFHKMWEVASCTKCKKPLHHISINPMKDERLTDEQVLAIVEKAEEIYGYKLFHHQRVIIEHVKEGRQHFHVIWNRVSLVTGKAVRPGLHWERSKQVAREMEEKLGLKRPRPKGAEVTVKGGKKGRNKTAHARKASPRIATKTRALKPTLGATDAFGARAFGTGASGTKARAAHTSSTASSTPTRPARVAGSGQKVWPLQAVIDWKDWGHKDPRWFFTVWPELVP